MAWKNPTLYLTNGKKQYCSLCKCDLISTEREFPMLPIKGGESITVKENVLFCPSCKKYYITQEMSRQFVQRHPGYYVDTSIYNFKPSKRKKNKMDVEGKSKSPVIQNSPDSQSIHSAKQNDSINISKQSIATTPARGIESKVYLSNAYAIDNNICSLCNNKLERESVNIPVIDNNGNFFRYYVCIVRFCHKCQKAFVTKENVLSILSRINSTSKSVMTVQLENATIHQSEQSHDYWFSPTLNNNHAIFLPEQDFHEVRSSQSVEMELNAQSFLGEMGYSVNKGMSTRRHILMEATKKYGKRRVADHIAYLITTRRAQKNGDRRYAHALHIWQDDLNYISSI